MSYILVLILFGSSGSPTAAAITTVSGYSSKATCEIAAREFNSRVMNGRPQAVCIPRQ